MYDERLAKIEQERQNALNKSNEVYNNLLQENQNNYDEKTNLINQYEQTQNDILDKQLKYNEDLIEKQRESAIKNKETEERKARNDYMNYINPYGYQNENLIQNGLLNSGVYTKENLGAFTTYQNRLSSANKVLQDAFVAYDNQINEARLNNDVQKAQNALAKLQQQISFADSFYSNKSNLTLNQLQYNQGLDSDYFDRYQTEYNNIQNEKAAAQAQANWEKEYNLSLQSLYGGGSSSSSDTDDSTSGGYGKGSQYADALNKMLGNSSSTVAKSDYYFTAKSGEDYQPRYIFNTKLTDTKKILSDLGTLNGVPGTHKIWKGIDENGKTAYYVWGGKSIGYIDVTDEYNQAFTKSKTKKTSTNTNLTYKSIAHASNNYTLFDAYNNAQKQYNLASNTVNNGYSLKR